MSGIANGISQLFKNWGRGIGNAADNFLLGADARKAIEDEVINKFKPRIDRFSRSESKRADTIKELGDKLNQSKADLKTARDQWQQNYNSALAAAKAQRQTDINNYNAELKKYQDAVDSATTGRQSIIDQLYNHEANYDPYRTLYTDVTTGDRYVLNPITNQYINLTKEYKKLTPKEVRTLSNSIQGYETRLFDTKSNNKVINAFDDSDIKQYGGKNNTFDNYLGRVRVSQGTALRNADNQITKAKNDLSAWQINNPNRPAAFDEKTFLGNYKKNNSVPNGYSFNGQTYTKISDLNNAYNQAVNHLQKRKNYFKGKVSASISERDKEIAKRIQDAKDIKKAKLALGGTLGAGALYAGAKAIYGGDDTDTTDNIDNTDNTNNTYTGEPDPDLKLENTSEGKALLNDEQQIDTGFDPDKADAIASAAYDQGVEDGNSIRSSADLSNKIGASTRGHTMEDRLYELIKAMKDPYKADAIANYIYSRHGDDPEVQNLGWRGWLNKYYGDSLRSIMNIDPSGYKGMHISGGL